MSLVRLGESKIYSTIRFEGGFCVFKRDAFDKFDDESGADDSGTALHVIQNRFRAIFIPDLLFFSEFPGHFGDRIKVKTRRALHLNGLWIRCLKLLLSGRLMLPKRIAIPEIFISIINPAMFFVVVLLMPVLLVQYPVMLVFLVFLLCLMSLFPRIRRIVVQGITDQLILFYSVILYLGKKKFIVWSK